MNLTKYLGGSHGNHAPRREPQFAAPAIAATSDAGLSGARAMMFEAGFGSGGSRLLSNVAPDRAERHATVYACCAIIAGDLAKVPLRVHLQDAAGPVEGHEANYLLNVESSPQISATTARFALGYSLCLRGNGFAWVPRNGDGEPDMIDSVLPNGVSISRAGRVRVYDFEDGDGARRRATGRTMMHLRHNALDGFTGRSPLECAAESVSIAMAGQDAAARSAKGGTIRAIAHVGDGYQDDEEWRRSSRRMDEALRDRDGLGIPIVARDDKITRLDLSAADMQLLETRKFDREMIAQIYRVPPSKLQMLENGVKANGEQQAIDYLTDCLFFWADLFETQAALSLLTEAERRAGLVLRHDFDALLRPTTKDRYEAAHRAVGGPWMTPNEARRSEGMGPVEDGDRLNPAPNMTREFESNERTEDE